MSYTESQLLLCTCWQALHCSQFLKKHDFNINLKKFVQQSTKSWKDQYTLQRHMILSFLVVLLIFWLRTHICLTPFLAYSILCHSTFWSLYFTAVDVFVRNIDRGFKEYLRMKSIFKPRHADAIICSGKGLQMVCGYPSDWNCHQK
jgi:hypothetical protein